MVKLVEGGFDQNIIGGGDVRRHEISVKYILVYDHSINFAHPKVLMKYSACDARGNDAHRSSV
jgi:hypothetical protein